MYAIDPTLPVCLLINPKSGYGSSKHMLSDLRSEIRLAGLQLMEYTTRGPGDATKFAATLPGRASVTIVWGGDGTASEVASGLAGSSLPILPCRAGTENLLAKELKIPLNPRQLVEILLSGQVVDCDVGTINDKNFMLIIGVGFDGEVVRRVASARSGHISHLSYFWPIWRTFWEHNFPKMRIIADGEEIFHDYGMAFIGNISRYAVGLRICRDAKFDDGLLDLVVFPCREQTSLMLHAAWTLLRMHPLKGSTIYRQVRKVRFETDEPVPSQIDGDVGPDTPLDISVADGRVKLLIPQQTSAWNFWPWIGAKT